MAAVSDGTGAAEPPKRGGTTRNVAVILVGTILGQGIALAVSPLLTRLYTTDDFGLMTVFVSVTSILGTLVLFRMDAVIPLPASDRVAAAVAWWALGLSMAGCLAIFALQPLIAAPLAALFNSPGLAQVWWLVALGTFVVGIDQVFLTWMVREKRYRALAVRNGLQGIGQAATQVGLGFGVLRSTGLLIGQVVGRVAAIGGLFSAGGLLRQRRPDRALMSQAMRRYRRFPLISSWSALINVLGQQAPFLVLSAYYGLTVAGLVGLTVRVMATPASLIGQAVSRVFQGEASAAIRDRRTPLRPILLSNGRMLLLVGAPVAILIAVVGPWAFRLVFGSEWTEAGTYAQILALGYLAQFVVSPVSQTLLLLEMQGAQLVWDIIRFVLTTGGPLLVALVGASPLVAVAVLSGTFVVCYAVLWWVCLAAATGHDARLPVRPDRPATHRADPGDAPGPADAADPTDPAGPADGA